MTLHYTGVEATYKHPASTATSFPDLPSSKSKNEASTNLKSLIGTLKVFGIGWVEFEEWCQVAEGLSKAFLAHTGEQLHIDWENALHIGEDGVDGITG